jgi:hypothetical protein
MLIVVVSLLGLIYVTLRGGRRAIPFLLVRSGGSEPVRPRLAPNTIIELTFGVARCFSCTMRVDCGQLDPAR